MTIPELLIFSGLLLIAEVDHIVCHRELLYKEFVTFKLGCMISSKPYYTRHEYYERIIMEAYIVSGPIIYFLFRNTNSKQIF